MGDADRSEVGRRPTSNWTVAWYGVLLFSSIAGVSFHAGAIAWVGNASGCTGLIDVGIIVAITVGAVSLFIEVRWLNVVVVVLCFLGITIFFVIVGFSEMLCRFSVQAGLPWPSV